jgi:adenine-specific DNA-methyltransferase
MLAKKTKAAAKAARHSSARFTDLDADKLRGGYYTSSEVAEWMCAWAIQSPKERVLEPSCGDGAFLEAAVKRYKAIGAQSAAIARQLKGVEISVSEARRATNRLKDSLKERATEVVVQGDFFEWWERSSQPQFDVAIGNPPFIRYQSFPEPYRSRAMALMAEQGLSPNRLTNIWVPFVVAAASSLRLGGRLALVLPAEVLQVTYASQLRSFLTDRFERIDIVACNELFFKRAEQEVVLLLADGALAASLETNPCRVTMTETRTVAEVTRRQPAVVIADAQPKTIRHDNEKWLKYFLSEREISFMRALREGAMTANLSAHASIDVGVVTGKNEFFVLTTSQVNELGLAGHTTPLVSRSAHLKGARVGKSDWNSMAAADDRVHLLYLKPDGGKLPAALARYIRFGEGNEVHKGYKCSIRNPWYAVPSVWNPDGFSFRQIYDFPRMVLNQAGATSTDTIHRLTSKKEKPERVIANTYTWLTAASAEIEGRSYGGGVLELEPTEAERLLMPAVLNGALPLTECDRLTRAGRLHEALEENARIVLMGHMGLSKSECFILRDIWTKMRDRRNARRRSRSSTGEDGAPA